MQLSCKASDFGLILDRATTSTTARAYSLLVGENMVLIVVVVVIVMMVMVMLGVVGRS